MAPRVIGQKTIARLDGFEIYKHRCSLSLHFYSIMLAHALKVMITLLALVSACAQIHNKPYKDGSVEHPAVLELQDSHLIALGAGH